MVPCVCLWGERERDEEDENVDALGTCSELQFKSRTWVIYFFSSLHHVSYALASASLIFCNVQCTNWGSVLDTLALRTYTQTHTQIRWYIEQFTHGNNLTLRPCSSCLHFAKESSETHFYHN